MAPTRKALSNTFWITASGALLILLFWPTWLWMAERFNAHDSFYSHGWLVPAASAWIIWGRRKKLALNRWPSSYAGLLLLVPALAAHLFAARWQINIISGIALLAVLAGLIWVFWGVLGLKALRFPLLFLIFMVPLPGVLLIAVSFQMKMMAAALACSLLKLMNVSAVQAGSTIHVPGVSVIVDDTCSGLRSLISLLALSVFWTALLPAKAKQLHRWMIVIASIPIALAANMVRILVLVMVAMIYGSKAAEGFIHYGSGIVVFGVAIASLAWLSHRLTAGGSLKQAAA